MKKTGLRKEFDLVTLTERVANLIRIFRQQEFRQSVPFLTSIPLAAMGAIGRNVRNLPQASINPFFPAEDSRFRPKERKQSLCEFP
jgi:hypothetical protein